MGVPTQGRLARMEGKGIFRAQLSFAILKNFDTAVRDYLVPFRSLNLASLSYCSDCSFNLIRAPKSSCRGYIRRFPPARGLISGMERGCDRA